MDNVETKVRVDPDLISDADYEVDAVFLCSGNVLCIFGDYKTAVFDKCL